MLFDKKTPNILYLFFLKVVNFTLIGVAVDDNNARKGFSQFEIYTPICLVSHFEIYVNLFGVNINLIAPTTS